MPLTSKTALPIDPRIGAGIIARPTGRASTPASRLLKTGHHYVYAHTRKTDGKVFYVGKGIAYRAWTVGGHINWWHRVVAKHGYDVQIIATFDSHEEAIQFEIETIAKYRALGYPLVNVTDGGEGTCGRVVSEESRDKMRGEKNKAKHPEIRAKISAKAKVNQNKPEVKARIAAAKVDLYTPEYLQRLSVSLTESHARPEVRAAISRGLKASHGKPEVKKRRAAGWTRARAAPDFWSNHLETLRQARCKPFVCQETGQHFEALIDAVKWLRSIGFARASEGQISRALDGNLRATYGFTWHRLNISVADVRTISLPSQERIGAGIAAAFTKSCKHTLCVETGRIFKNSADAAKWLRETGQAVKASGGNICAACMGQHEIIYGYHWKRVKDPIT